MTAAPERCRFQYSLRKLMLWTAIWALCLSAIKTEGFSAEWTLIWAACLLVLFGIRIKWGLLPGLPIAAVGSGVVSGSLAWMQEIREVVPGLNPSTSELFVGFFSAGGLIATFCFLVIHSLAVLVDWIDKPRSR